MSILGWPAHILRLFVKMRCQLEEPQLRLAPLPALAHGQLVAPIRTLIVWRLTAVKAMVNSKGSGLKSQLV